MWWFSGVGVGWVGMGCGGVVGGGDRDGVYWCVCGGG